MRARDLFVRTNVAMIAIAVAVRAFDARIFYVRSLLSVQHDALVHYNMLLTWWRHGDSPRGFTLTPSPYFIDMLVQLPIMLLAPDFERFSYALACTYCLLIFGALYVVFRVVLEAHSTVAVVASGVAVAAFYVFSPFNFVVHVFVVNHTSEIFTTLGVLALAHAWFRPGVTRRRYAAYVYALVVAGCVASSPFFVATYCIPATIAAGSVVGSTYLTRRRFVWFVGLTALGALVGLISLAIISRYAWPVRGDSYQRWWKSYLALKAAIIAEPGGLRAVWLAVIACVASIALAVAVRKRNVSIPLRFMLAFIPAAIVTCVVLPVKRGAFDGAYAFRYFTFPCLLVIAFYVGTATQLAKMFCISVLRRRALARPRWLPWSTGLLGAISFVLLATCHGSFSMDDDASRSAPFVRCFRDLDQRGELKDGLSTWWLGRFFIAARLAPAWSSPHVILEIRPYDGRIDPWDNNVLWFADGFRAGKGRLNFLVTFGLSEEALEMFRNGIGAPDRRVSCAVPANQRLEGRETFEFWIWNREEAQRKLTALVLGDNGRSPFSPVVGATSIAIDPVWGMDSAIGTSELIDRRRVWRRGSDSTDPVAWIHPMYVPSGRYRLDLDLTTVALSTSTGPALEVVVRQNHHGELLRAPIVANPPPPRSSLTWTTAEDRLRVMRSKS